MSKDIQYQKQSSITANRIGGGLTDWRAFADHFGTMTCILSVEKKADGSCGTVRIVTGNQQYLDSLEIVDPVSLREEFEEELEDAL